jgi:hypothetical protein
MGEQRLILEDQYLFATEETLVPYDRSVSQRTYFTTQVWSESCADSEIS